MLLHSLILDLPKIFIPLWSDPQCEFKEFVMIHVAELIAMPLHGHGSSLIIGITEQYAREFCKLNGLDTSDEKDVYLRIMEYINNTIDGSLVSGTKYTFAKYMDQHVNVSNATKYAYAFMDILSRKKNKQQYVTGINMILELYV